MGICPSEKPVSQKPRILVIRGGALGDFILTLPAIALIKEAFPDAHLELIGYPHIASLAVGRFYFEAVRSVDFGPLAGFYAKNGTLDPALVEYFSGFQQVVSYLYDPDGIFEENVRKAGAKNYLPAYRKVQSRHAAREWAHPLESLALYLENPAARIHLSGEDLEKAWHWLGETRRPRLVIHPGSGSASKNWPVAGWKSVGLRFLRENPEGELVLVGGEADVEVLDSFLEGFSEERLRVARNLPLPLLAGVLAACGRFAGHDTGVSHLAAAVGARCVLLFAPTDPALWAPQNEGVQVLRAPEGDWSRLLPGEVWRAVGGIL